MKSVFFRATFYLLFFWIVVNLCLFSYFCSLFLSLTHSWNPILRLPFFHLYWCQFPPPLLPFTHWGIVDLKRNGCSTKLYRQDTLLHFTLLHFSNSVHCSYYTHKRRIFRQRRRWRCWTVSESVSLQSNLIFVTIPTAKECLKGTCQ